VLDDSPKPCPFMQELSDPRILYEHLPERKTIGAKRNQLIQKSRAPIIAHFDDDDFYAPDYLSRMIGAMEQANADMVKLYGFFLYSKLHKSLGYWDLTTKLGPHWIWSQSRPSVVTLTEQNNVNLKDIHLGYGFSYVFKKKVWDFSQFPDIDWNEDGKFMADAVQRFTLTGLPDSHFTSLHVIHQSSTSRCFPQYTLPHFLVARLFPKAEALLAVADGLQLGISTSYVERYRT
jgi:glycosyltransferase involved in cell wall biosynthesis